MSTERRFSDVVGSRPPSRRPLLWLAVAIAVAAAVVALLTAGGSDPAPEPDAGPVPTTEPGPPSAPPGWRTLWQDDFSATSVDTRRWFTYSGEPNDGPGAWWQPDHLLQSNGILTLRGSGEPARAGQLVTGGVNSGLGQAYTYGRYLLRMRVAPSSDVAFGVLLVPPGRRAGEGYVVVAGDGGGDRRKVRGGLRTRSLSGAPVALERSSEVDLREWHVIGVDWSPGLLRFLVDGRSWGTVRSPLVPSTPLVLALQTQAVCTRLVAGRCVARSATPVDMEVDWVTALARGPAGAS